MSWTHQSQHSVHGKHLPLFTTTNQRWWYLHCQYPILRPNLATFRNTPCLAWLLSSAIIDRHIHISTLDSWASSYAPGTTATKRNPVCRLYDQTEGKYYCCHRSISHFSPVVVAYMRWNWSWSYTGAPRRLSSTRICLSLGWSLGSTSLSVTALPR